MNITINNKIISYYLVSNLFQHLCSNLGKKIITGPKTVFTIHYYSVITDSYHEVDIDCLEKTNLIEKFEKTYECKIGISVNIIHIKPKKFCLGCYYNELSQRFRECLGY